MGTKTADNHRPTSEEAREVLMQEQQANLQACRQEIDAVLEKHNCRLEAEMLLRAGQVIPRVQIVPNPEGN